MLLLSRMWAGIARGLLLVALVPAPAATAADFYLGGGIGISPEATGTANGVNSFTSPNFDIHGRDTDSAPTYSGVLGMEVALDEALPWFRRVPRWDLRLEAEATGGRDYEFTTPGFTATEPYRSHIKAWSLLANLYLDVPVYPAFSALFGRLAVVEPLSVYAGAGIGLGSTELSASDTSTAGDESAYLFAWQAGAGFSYELTEHVDFALGYRYVDLGRTSASLEDSPPLADPQDRGNFQLDLSAHELQSTLRIKFFSFPLPGFWSRPNRFER
jgi:opacity protein-like surface antigen